MLIKTKSGKECKTQLAVGWPGKKEGNSAPTISTMHWIGEMYQCYQYSSVLFLASQQINEAERLRGVWISKQN